MALKCETNVLQFPPEFEEFIHLAKSERVTRYLEIGCKNGGSLWRMANALPKGSRVVAVDLPHGDGSFKVTEPNLIACVEELKGRGYDVTLFLGDSTDPEIVFKVAQLAPFDLCFLDANHTEPYIWKDWQNYRSMARIFAFHDINHYYPVPAHKSQIHVAKVWNEIKKDFRYIEIKKCKDTNGIGVIWNEPQPAQCIQT